jgi:conjugative relaxase-like TrwC/TraI family protein
MPGREVISVMSMHKLVAAEGYTYLTQQVAVADGHLPAAEPLLSYYDATGTPPGRWAGAGLWGLGDGRDRLRPGSIVTERAMASVFRDGHDPISRVPLGRAFGKGSVRGYDLTFTVPKSAAVLWALAVPSVRAEVEAAHHAAVAQALDVVDRSVLRTRVGPAGSRQVITRGMVAAAFDHYDTRAGDPGLHTHVVLANKVQGPDRRWRSVDGKTIHAATVAVSELYDGFFADEVQRRLHVTWSHRPRGVGRNDALEIDGVDDRLIRAFSSRTERIHEAELAWAEDFRSVHGRSPSRVETIRARQHLTRATRPAKTVRPLSELLADWANRARALTGLEPVDLAARALGGDYARGLNAHDVGPTTRAALVAQTLIDASEHRSVWTTWNLRAAAARATVTLRMHDPDQRTRLLDQLVAAAAGQCVRLDAGRDPAHLRAGESLYTSTELLAAERVLLDAAASTDFPYAFRGVEARTLASEPRLSVLTGDQSEAVRRILLSSARLDVLVGPAGTGKTTTLAALVGIARQRGIRVMGLAPSASAAQTLHAALGIPTETTAKWLYEACGPGAARRSVHHDEAARARVDPRVDFRAREFANTTMRRARAAQDEWRFTLGQVVIVDEASLADTRTLATLVQLADQADAKVVLVGDHLQRGAVGPGGAFGMLARRGPTAELSALHRFRQPWEARASLEVRHGQPRALDAYTQHGAILEGELDSVIDRALDAAEGATQSGRVALLQAADLRTVRELNARAHQRAVLNGDATPNGVTLRDGLVACVGDRVLTRLNARQLRTRDGYVRNGTLWTVAATHRDGSVEVRPIGDDARSPADGTIRLPARYVAEHVELGYAVTTARSQGLTVDESHTIATAAMGREDLYVAVTRGRDANRIYVATDVGEDHQPPGFAGGEPVRPTGRELLERVLATTRAELSATETWATFHPLAAAPVAPPGRVQAQSPRYIAELEASGVLPRRPAPLVHAHPANSPAHVLEPRGR